MRRRAFLKTDGVSSRPPITSARPKPSLDCHAILSAGIYLHTNHLLFEKTKDYSHEDQEYKNSSSLSRYAVISEKINQLVDGPDVKPEIFLSMLSSHENKPYSPCRHPEDDVHGQTLGTAFFDINRGRFYLYKGNPCQAVPEGLCVEMGF